MATVTARTDTSLLSLGRDEFLGAVTGHAASADAADAVIASRLRASRPALLQL
jgi:CRP-like cAMP-binding protein